MSEIFEIIVLMEDEQKIGDTLVAPSNNDSAFVRMLLLRINPYLFVFIVTLVASASAFGLVRHAENVSIYIRALEQSVAYVPDRAVKNIVVEHQAPVLNTDEVIFTGIVDPGGQDSCPVDGICSIIVDGVEVIWAQGWPRELVGKMSQNLNIGDQVEVYGRKGGDRAVTLYGSEDYYIKYIGD